VALWIQGDQMSLWKSRPKCSPTHFLSKQKRSPKFFAGSVIFQKIPDVNNHPMDENSPNLVTMHMDRQLFFLGPLW
jgi:hypothetical protein